MALHIGLISGTSADAVDAALVELDSDRIELVACHSETIPQTLSTTLRAVIDDARIDRSVFWQLDVQIGELFAAAAVNLLENAGVDASEVRAIGSHGQTVFHAPQAPYPTTVQIGDPNVIAERTGITTVADMRRRDLAAGGQGAPLAPAFHAAVFRSRECDRVVVNIGGIANLTLLPCDQGAEVIGFDTGPGNTLMDVWIERVRGARLDVDAAWARSGASHAKLLQALLGDAYFSLAPPKSTGRERFNLAWLDAVLAELGEEVAAQDVQRTLCELTAVSIAEAIAAHASAAREVLVCGGGVHNPLIMERLDEHLSPIEVASTERVGFDPDWVEAAAFAWLAARTLDGKSGTLPSVTGAKRPAILGGIYKGG